MKWPTRSNLRINETKLSTINAYTCKRKAVRRKTGNKKYRSTKSSWVLQQISEINGRVGNNVGQSYMTNVWRKTYDQTHARTRKTRALCPAPRNVKMHKKLWNQKFRNIRNEGNRAGRTKWPTPIGFLQKKYGSLRFFWAIRSRVSWKNSSYATHRMIDGLALVGDALILLRLDDNCSYRQVAVKYIYCDKTALAWHSLLFQFPDRPFIVLNSVAIFLQTRNEFTITSRLAFSFGVFGHRRFQIWIRRTDISRTHAQFCRCCTDQA